MSVAWTSRRLASCFSLLLCMFAAGCGDAGKLEQIALDRQEFSGPITFHLDSDGSAENDVLFGLNGIDARPYTSLTWSGGPDHFNGNYTGCYWNSNGGLPDASSLSLNARINADAQSFSNQNAVFNWLINHNVVGVYVSAIRYTNLAYPGYGTAITWYCPVVNDKFASVHAVSWTGSYHGGVDIGVAKRRLLEWTYNNSYETEIPGKGKVRFFAGTFKYTADATVPDVAFGNDGAGNVKMYLDPDTGKWTVDTFNLHDPTITLQNAGAPNGNPYTVDPRIGLFDAINHGDWNELRALLESGVDINAPRSGITPLMSAIGKLNSGDKTALTGIKELLAHGAQTEVRTNWGGTALWMAVYHADAAKMLLDKGAAVDAQMRNGETPLFNAPLDTAALLIAHGADVNVKSNTGDTPLHAAVRSGLFPKIQLLISHGANVNASNNAGQTPIEALTQFGDKKIAPFLKAHGATAEAPSYLPALADQLKSRPYRQTLIAMSQAQPVSPWFGNYLNLQAASVEGPGHLVTVGTSKYEIYSTCEAHNCGANMYYVLFAQGARQAWALHQSTMAMQAYEFYGNPDNEKQSILLGAMHRVLNGQGF